MSRDVITVGSTMRIPLLYRGEYSQWRERFMNYLEEQTDGEAMINSILNGDHPLPVIAQVSLDGTAPNAPPTLKDPQFWTAEEKKNRKIDRLARSLLIQGLPNDIYSLIDSNDTAKDLWDALERQMRGSEYGEQDRKAAILYEYETFKATEGEQNCMILLFNGNVAVMVTSDPIRLVAEKTKVNKRKEKVAVQSESEGSDDEDISDLKKITALLAKAFNRKKYYRKQNEDRKSMMEETGYEKKLSAIIAKKMELRKDSDEQLLLAEDQAWMESSSDSDQEINANMVFMAKMENVLSDSEESSSSAEETIAEVSYYTSDFEKFASENFDENHIVSQKDHDESEVDHNDSEEKDHLVDKLIKKFNQKIAKRQKMRKRIKQSKI
ncbi:hypothetical protein Tco_0682659 [Tanacetum coccineum]|uniref:DUF4219 domain-containing protein n=1 Tax=Tanacetum coccineum TaxID=301880 RepID=A0ABQ4XRT3_9ASTR